MDPVLHLQKAQRDVDELNARRKVLEAMLTKLNTERDELDRGIRSLEKRVKITKDLDLRQDLAQILVNRGLISFVSNGFVESLHSLIKEQVANQEVISLRFEMSTFHANLVDVSNRSSDAQKELESLNRREPKLLKIHRLAITLAKQSLAKIRVLEEKLDATTQTRAS